MASASYPWADEAALLNETNAALRSTYIIDAGAGHRIGRDVFLSAPYLSFYEAQGFDRNYFTWAPLTSVGDAYADGHKWTGCRNPPDVPGSNGLQALEPDGRRLCVPSAVATAPLVHEIRTDVQSGPLEGFQWGDAFVSDDCGNWAGPADNTPKPRPIPSISGVKYEDANADGLRQPNEPGLPGWTIELFYNGTHVASTTTDANGSYRFFLDADNLPIGAGSYSLGEVAQPGWQQSAAPSPISVDFGAGNTDFAGNDFGNWQPASIAGTKFEDLDADGPSAGDPGVADVAIQADGPTPASTLTGSDGSYRLAGLRPGTYTVTELPQPGWVQSYPGSGSYQITLVSGQAAAGTDFANWRPGQIIGRKFDDRGVDGSGVGDPGIAGWTICLTQGGCTTTAADGSFAFTGLKPGGYTVTEAPRSGWRATAPTSGSFTFTVRSGTTNQGEIGNICLGSLTVSAPAGVSDQLQELFVPGVLANDPALPRTGSGNYQFTNLLPGSYKLTLILPDGVFSTDPDLTAIGGGFAIVKTVTVSECTNSTVAPPFVTTQPGKITGGIRILVPGGFATGGFEFQQRSDGPRGTLEYNDHATGLRIHTNEISAISVSGTDAYIFGYATLADGNRYRFRLHLVDAGEPGTSDHFELSLANGYTAGFGEFLDGGNVQLH
jgi:hypothetical protein